MRYALAQPRVFFVLGMNCNIPKVMMEVGHGFSKGLFVGRRHGFLYVDKNNDGSGTLRRLI